MPTFIVVEDGKTRHVTVDKPIVTLGRSSSNGIAVVDLRVSRHHCTFLLREDVMTVRDEGSQNGTFVNGALVDRTAIKPGDRIDIGAARIYYDQMPRDDSEEDVTWAGVDPDRLYKAPLPARATGSSASSASPARSTPRCAWTGS